MATFNELRVHGVSGTPPRDMLYTDPVTDAKLDDYTKVYRVPATDEGYDPEAQAFHWGGLTAGSWHTAFWILLAPFALANVAGWLVSRRNRGTVVGVRLAGLALTALFSSQALTAAVVVHGWFHNRGLTGWVLRVATFALFGALLALVIWITGILSTQSHFTPLDLASRVRLLVWPSRTWLQPPRRGDDSCPQGSDPDWSDPAFPLPGDDSPWVADRRLWCPHSILHRIRRCHFAVGLAIISVGLTRAMDLPDRLYWSGIVMLGAAAVVLVLTTLIPQASWNVTLTAWMTPIALGQTTVLTFLTLSADVPLPGEWQGLHQTNLIISLMFGVACFLALGFGAGKAVGALALAAFFGGAMGIASITVLERLTEPAADSRFSEAISRQSFLTNGAGWVSVWMLVMVLVLVIVASVLSFVAVRPEPVGRSKQRDALVRLRRVIHRAQWLLRAAIVVGLAAAVGIGLLLCEGGCRPSNLRVEDWGVVTWLLVAAAVTLTFALWPTGNWLLRFAVPLGAAAVIVAARLGFLDFRVLRVPVDLTRLVDASLTVAVLIPASLIFRSITGGIGNKEKRRKTGLLWDVASFWPRYFHPLGPPAYGPNAVNELRKEVTGSDALTLSAHSQGSVIATVTLCQMSPTETANLRQVITFGSPLRLIYAHLFNQAGLDRLLETKCGHEQLTWTNLWRRSDYLGGLPLPLPDEAGANMEADYVGHSGYECTRQFRKLKTGVRPIDPADESVTCGARRG
ncbi:MAG: hypothetical protein ACRDWS_12480 [Acidimicrobiia bacterium]